MGYTLPHCHLFALMHSILKITLWGRGRYLLVPEMLNNLLKATQRKNSDPSSVAPESVLLAHMQYGLPESASDN